MASCWKVNIMSVRASARGSFAAKTPAGGGSFYRTPINIDAAAGVPDGYPILIHSDMFSSGASHGFFQNAQTNGGDIRVFSDASLTVGLPLEIKAFDKSTGLIEAYARITSAIAQNGKLYLRTASDAGSLSQPAATDSLGAYSVWDDYAYVSHDLASVSKNGISVTNTGGQAQTGPNDLGARGYGATYGVGSTDRSATSYNGNDVLRSVSAYVYRNGDGGGSLGRMWDFGNWGAFYNSSTNYQLQCVFDNAGSSASSTWNVSRPASGSFKHIAVLFDATSVSNDPVIYIDGVSQTVTNFNRAPAGSLKAAGDTLNVGNRLDATRNWDGMIGEFRLAASVLSSARIIAEAANLLNPGSFAHAETGGFV